MNITVSIDIHKTLSIIQKSFERQFRHEIQEFMGLTLCKINFHELLICKNILGFQILKVKRRKT